MYTLIYMYIHGGEVQGVPRLLSLAPVYTTAFHLKTPKTL